MQPHGQGHEGETSFVRELVHQFRTSDSRAWDGKTDAEVLAPLVRRDRRRAGAEDGSVDPEVFWRIEIFFQAVARTLEARTGIPCAPMLRMHHEGFGRVVVLAGRLVAVTKTLRDVHRFGFDSVEALIEAGERLVTAGTLLIHRFPEVAHHT
jgi:probable nitrogen fixation protein